MEREFPKNVKQIGNVCDEPKIYVEDYVDTYLNQLKEKAKSAPVGAVLTGEILKLDGQDVVYVAGALKLCEMEAAGGDVKISAEAWDKLEEEKQRFFSGQEIVGWCIIGEGQPAGLSKGVKRIHEKRFRRENTVFVWRDAVLDEEAFYANKFGELMQMGGHYIFYEKNPSMQNYMINMRKKIGVTPSEVVEDRAAKNFRSAVKEKMEYKEQKQSARFAYVVSVALVVVVLVIGISTINNYDKMEAVQNSLEALSQTVSRPAAQEADAERQEEDGLGEGDALTSPDAVETVSKAVTAKEDADDRGEDSSGDSAKKNESEAEVNIPDTTDSQGGQQAEGADAESASSEGNYYVVQKGDTLDKISIKIYGNRDSVDAICRMNGLTDGNLIIIGQKLMLP